MTATIRRMFLALALLFGLAATGAACAVRAHPAHWDWDVAFEVHNQHDEDVWIEAVDEYGFVHEFGHVYAGETVTFVVSDFWEGRRFRARCECDGAAVHSEYVYDGLHWDVY